MCEAESNQGVRFSCKKAVSEGSEKSKVPSESPSQQSFQQLFTHYIGDQQETPKKDEAAFLSFRFHSFLILFRISYKFSLRKSDPSNLQQWRCVARHELFVLGYGENIKSP